MKSLIRIAVLSFAGLAAFSWLTTAGWPTFWTTPIYRLELWLIFHHLNEAFLGTVFALGCADLFLVWRGLQTLGAVR